MKYFHMRLQQCIMGHLVRFQRNFKRIQLRPYIKTIKQILDIDALNSHSRFKMKVSLSAVLIAIEFESFYAGP
jgi:hypothetical protein